jgi:hypothetical protein
MAEAIEHKARDKLRVKRCAEITLLGDITIRDFDGQATFGYYTGFTFSNPNFPFKRLKNVIRAEGEEVLRT